VRERSAKLHRQENGASIAGATSATYTMTATTEADSGSTFLVVVDGRTGILYTPGNATELADNLQALLNDPKRAAELGRNARKRCESEYTLEIQYQRYLAAVKKRLPETA